MNNKSNTAEKNERPEALQECDAYRSFTQISEPDERGVGIMMTTSLENWHQYIESVLMRNESLPHDLIIQIETGRNLYLYSWHVYRFGVVAHTHFLNILELSLDLKFKKEGLEMLKGMSRKLEYALSKGWFDDSCFSHLKKEEGEKKHSQITIKGLVGIRNSLNHGSTFLYDPMNMLSHSVVCMDIINRLHEK